MKNIDQLKQYGFKISKELEEFVSKMSMWKQGDFSYSTHSEYTGLCHEETAIKQAKIFIDKDTDIVITQKIK